jgi:hypothetical protein
MAESSGCGWKVGRRVGGGWWLVVVVVVELLVVVVVVAEDKGCVCLLRGLGLAGLGLAVFG